MEVVRRLKEKIFIKPLVSWIYLIFSFFALDAWLRIATRYIGWYSIYEVAPNLFTLCWSVIFTTLVVIIPNRRIGRIIYGFIYFVWMIYVVVQYATWVILESFLFLNDFLLAKEGMDYVSYVLEFINLRFIASIFVLSAIGVGGIIIYIPSKTKDIFILWIGSLISLVVMIFLPNLYGEGEGFADYAYEYKNFNVATRDVELTGIYQFVFRDMAIQIEKQTKIYDETHKRVDAYFEQELEHTNNDMTSVFKEKMCLLS